MAYKSIYNIECSSKAEFFCNLRDFLCKRNGTYNDYSVLGIGWTLLDAVYTVDEDNPEDGDYIILQSKGENGDISTTVKIEWSGVNYISIIIYLAWDTSTHTGSATFMSAASLNISSSRTSIVLNVFGNLDFVHNVYTYADTFTDYKDLSFGKCLKPFTNTSDVMAVSSSAVSSGSDVSITLDVVPEEWYEDGEIYIWTTTDAIATAKAEKTTIKTIIGTVITCDLTNSYTAGFKMSQHYGIGACGDYLNRISTYLSQAGISYTYTGNSVNSYFGCSPGSFESRYIMSSIWYGSSTSESGGVYGFIPFAYTIQNPFTKINLGDVLEDINGDQYRYLKCYSSLYACFLEA